MTNSLSNNNPRTRGIIHLLLVLHILGIRDPTSLRRYHPVSVTMRRASICVPCEAKFFMTLLLRNLAMTPGMGVNDCDFVGRQDGPSGPGFNQSPHQTPYPGQHP